MPDLLSGLIIEVPEAEPAVGDLRLRLDAVAALGVPAHVTALFPFVRPPSIDAEVLERVGRVARACDPFGYAFRRTAWFGDDVLYLAPEDPQPFRALTMLLCEAFPDNPPYGGQFAEVVPHLTIGDRAGRPALREAERQVQAYGPIAGRAERLTLMVQSSGGRWSSRARWLLGGSEPGDGPAEASAGAHDDDERDDGEDRQEAEVEPPLS